MTSSLTSSWPSAASCSRTASTVMPAGWPPIDTPGVDARVARVVVCAARRRRAREKMWGAESEKT